MSEKRHRIKPVHTDRARRLRRVMTGPERHLWSVLRDKQIGGLRFRRQHPVGRFIADFACLEAHLIVEVDGESHVGQFDADNARTRELMRQGFKVLRFTNDEVLQATEAVANTIARAAGLDW
ncbi:MAG: DUF559 domain-containing protein [Planctomycetes bacterium]|nr:DUF559 domain-containing protein [Planctomycetota bacterium]